MNLHRLTFSLFPGLYLTPFFRRKTAAGGIAASSQAFSRAQKKKKKKANKKMSQVRTLQPLLRQVAFRTCQQWRALSAFAWCFVPVSARTNVHASGVLKLKERYFCEQHDSRVYSCQPFCETLVSRTISSSTMTEKAQYRLVLRLLCSLLSISLKKNEIREMKRPRNTNALFRTILVH